MTSFTDFGGATVSVANTADGTAFGAQPWQFR